MNVKDILTKSRKNTEGLLKTNKGTSKEAIYKKEIFEGLSDNEKKHERRKIRDHVTSIFESIVFAKKENKKDVITKLSKDFVEIYKEAYKVNDFSLSSITSENRKDKDTINLALDIIKAELKIK